MKFRDMEIDDIIVLEDLTKEELETELKNMANKYKLIDLQFSSIRGIVDGTLHSALALVRNKEIIIMVGNIGAGKSTYVKQYVDRGYRVISKNAIRYMFGGGKYIFDIALEKEVDDAVKNTTIGLTYAGYNVIVDETNMTINERKDYLHYIKEEGTKNNPQPYKRIALIFPKLSKEESVCRRLQANHGDTTKKVWEEV